MCFYNLLLPLKLDWFPVYKSETTLHRGQRVEVSFCSRIYPAVVLEETEDPSSCDYNILEVSYIPDNLPDITEQEFKLWSFVSEYYLCTMGEVYAAAYPKYKRSVSKRKKSLEQGSVQKKPELSSGKPELYCGREPLPYFVEKIRECTAKGGSVLVLSSEKELASLMKERLSGELDCRILLYDSSVTVAARKKLTDAVRAAQEPLVLVGTRSALFLPYTNLGLVIVEEEQDALYKQTEPAPHYNARDLASVLASIHGAQLILSSFTPSLESLYNCNAAKYKFIDAGVELNCRLEVVDVNEEKKKRGMEGEYSKRLMNELRHCKGELRIVRSYSSEEEVAKYFQENFPDLNPQILTAYNARKCTSRCSLLVILNGDSLFDKEDFRSDEKAFQLLRSLACLSDKVFIQCSCSKHPVFSSLKNLDYAYRLLEERKQFNMPPFTRIVDIKDKKSGQLVLRKFFGKDARSAQEKAQLPLRYGAMYLIDVDPL